MIILIILSLIIAWGLKSINLWMFKKLKNVDGHIELLCVATGNIAYISLAFFALRYVGDIL